MLHQGPTRNNQTMLKKLTASNATAGVWLIRLAIGAVFVPEGIQKFLFPDALGVGRFTKIGIPAPEIFAPFVAVCEIVCGALLLLGVLTRLATIPLITDMIVAMATTKLPILLKSGFWAMAHEARTDFAMLLGCVFLLIVGAGSWSLDAWWSERESRPQGDQAHPPGQVGYDYPPG
jgi:putative oxidoreductase